MTVYSANVVIEAIGDYYDDLVGREPTDGEVRLYLAGYRTNPSLDAIRSGIAGSTEARNALARLFRDVLERDADPDRLNQLQQSLVDGASLGDVRERLEGSIVLPEESSGPDENPVAPEPGGEELPSPNNLQPSSDDVRDAVNGLYQDVLGRDAEGAALDFWQQAVGNGLPLANLRTALASSIEARRVIGSLYEDVLGREGDDAGLRFFQGVLAGDDADLDDVRTVLAASDEARLAVNGLYEDVLGREGDGAGLVFFQRSLAGDDADFDDVRAVLAGSDEARAALNGLYRDVLGREGDVAGLDFWQRQLIADDASLDGVRAALARSGEARLAANSLYEEVLGREGDAAGLEFWQGVLAAGNVELDDVRASLANSAEAEADDVISINASSTSMTFLAPTEMSAPLTAISGSEVNTMAGQMDWRLSASSPFVVPSSSMIFSASEETLSSTPLSFAANVPSLLVELSDPLHVSSPVIG